MQNKPKLLKPAPLAPGFGDADGAVISHAGRYAREAVLVAYEMIGGVERMADWADKNPTDFFTKLFPKVITKEVEIGATKGVEDLLARLDAAEEGGYAPMDAPVIEADFEEEEEEDE